MINAAWINNTKEQERFLIVGFGVTGKALADFFEARQKFYFVCEDKDPEASSINLEKKLENTKSFFAGFLKSNTTAEELKLKNIKGVFPSPGVALTHPVIQAARQNEIPVVGELELASFFLEADFIAVTGTNGKSTTVRLISELLEGASLNNGLKGNIGSPLITAVNETPKNFYVIEESSYQLELVGNLKHHVAVCLNVTDDHFDRYANIEEYAQAKAQIFTHSTSADLFAYNYDDPHCLRMSYKSKAHNVPFSLVHEFAEGAFTRNFEMVIRLKENDVTKEYIFDLKKCALKGLHNIENMLAALIAVLFIKNDAVAVASYQRTLAQFVGLPHRLQKVLEHKGVEYYDDSKGTNVGAVVMALASFEGDIILIAGGRDKQGDYAPLKGLIKGKVKKLILLGEARNIIYQALKGTTEIDLVSDMKEAVLKACKSAKSGDVVLLSPACSSFDQYKNYAERGDDFQSCVREICCK